MEILGQKWSYFEKLAGTEKEVVCIYEFAVKNADLSINTVFTFYKLMLNKLLHEFLIQTIFLGKKHNKYPELFYFDWFSGQN